MENGFVWRSLRCVAWSLVLLLLFPCGPAAIVRFVVAINVNAVDCGFREWARAHVSQECGEVAPFSADLYPTPTVVLEHGPPMVFAPTTHVEPRAVFAGFAATGMPVGRILEAVGSRSFLSQTAATANSADAKRITTHNCLAPAVATASPSDAAVLFCVSARDHNEAPNSKSIQRDECRHRRIVPDKWGDR